MAEQEAQKTDEELEAAIPPRGANDAATKAEEQLANVDMDEQREALKKLQKNLPSAGE